MFRRYFSISTSLLFLLSLSLFAQTQSVDQSEIRLPWDEFKKLIRLDAQEIRLSLATFEKLVRQTGSETKPPHQVQNGQVTLSRAEFDKLVDRMKSPDISQAPPPFEYLMTRSIYSGKMTQSNTDFTGRFEVHVLKPDVYVRVPILQQQVALEDVTVNGQKALIVNEGGYHAVLLNEPGTYNVVAQFSVRTAINRGPQKIDLSIQRTPVTLFSLEIPLKQIDVEIPQAQQIQKTERGGKTVVSAVIAPTHAVSVQWRKQIAVTEKIPPKLYSELFHLISLEDDALKMNSDVTINVLHSEVDGVRLQVPEQVNILSVTGEGVGDWQETEQQGERVLIVPFTYGKKGAVHLNIRSEKTFSEENTVLFSGLRVLESVRENGFIGVELNTSAEVNLENAEGVEKIPVQKLPQHLASKSAKPLILGFKYLKHPYSFVLQIEKHEKIAVPVATIQSANAVTLFTEDGKEVLRLVYQVRNSAKQFLEIKLPENADVWSVFVADNPVEASISRDGHLLVPLIRSRSVNNRLETFSIEVIFARVHDRFALLKWLPAELPAVDLLVSQIMWSVYLPNDYHYLYFQSTLEKEEMIRGLNVLRPSKRLYDEEAANEVYQMKEMESRAASKDEMKKVYKGKEAMSRFRNVPMEEDQVAVQMDAELGFSGRMDDLAQQVMPQAAVSGAGGRSTGVLPIQIKIPTSGQVYRFAKTIVNPEDPLTMQVLYARSGLLLFFRWILILLILLIIWLLRKFVWRLLKSIAAGLSAVIGYVRQHWAVVRVAWNARITPFVLAGLTILFFGVFRWLAYLMLFLLWINGVAKILQHFQARREKKLERKPARKPADKMGGKNVKE